MKNSYCYYKNEACKYFPCHKAEGEFFNCMFCYCPLYALGDKCGGNFVYLKNGIKDCSGCFLPHGENGYLYINSRLSEISGLAKKRTQSKRDR